MYKVLETFADLQDNKHIYYEGDIYPRNGLSVSDVRLAELSTTKNATHRPLIVEVEETPKVSANTRAKVETETHTEAEDETVDTVKQDTEGVVEIKPKRRSRKKLNNNDDN